MWQLARQPKWIGGLLLCLAIAAVFALLAQWQISRSVEDGQIIERETEQSVPLQSVAEPQGPVTTASAGQLVTVTGTLQANDFSVLTGRLNTGEEAYWLVGHLVVGHSDDQSDDQSDEQINGQIDGPINGTDATDGDSIAADWPTPSLAVALGWAPTLEAALAAGKNATTGIQQQYTGRYLVSESPQEDDFEEGMVNSLAVSALINQWTTSPQGVYGGYLVVANVDGETGAPAGLQKIDSPPPSTEVVLNWLNVFYAVEWVVFAGFAVYLWYRLLRDEWVRDREDEAERELAVGDLAGREHTEPSR
jgi:surfeit locus 1 family protein